MDFKNAVFPAWLPESLEFIYRLAYNYLCIQNIPKLRVAKDQEIFKALERLMIERTSEHISAANEKANSLRRKQIHALTPGERLSLARQLQQSAFATMRSNPEAVRAFIKRNHHRRRVSNVKRLELEMKRECGFPDE